jgi:hypothetical protein
MYTLGVIEWRKKLKNSHPVVWFGLYKALTVRIGVHKVVETTKTRKEIAGKCRVSNPLW